MEKIRVLTVAPYPDFCSVARQAAAEFPMIHQEIFLGNLEEAIAYAQEFPNQEFDVILSRGGTAELLRGSSSIPVLETRISPYDLLCAIQAAQALGVPFAITGFSSIIQQAQLLCGILNLREVPVCHLTADSAAPVIHALRNQGIGCIVGDVISVETAAEAGLRGVLIASSGQSLAESFSDILSMHRYAWKESQKRRLFQSAADNCAVGILATDLSGNLLYANGMARALGLPELRKCLRDQIPRLEQSGKLHLVRHFSKSSVDIQGFFLDGEDRCALFYLRNIRQLNRTPEIISIEDQSDYGPQLQTGFPAEIYLAPVRQELEDLNRSGRPFLLQGAAGTEKGSIARWFHMHSRLSASPFVHIHSQFLQQKHWDAFSSPASSQLYGDGCTLFFEDVHLMDLWTQQVIAQYLKDAGTVSRHQILFSSSVDLGEMVRENRFQKELYYMICGHMIRIPSMCERRSEIPALATLYLLQYNTSLGKRIAGFEPQALQLLSQQPWPLNLSQFSAVILHLVQQCEDFYICAKEVRQILGQLDFPQGADHSPSLDLHKPLADIERDIIQVVLTEEQNNQTAAAHRLGISRSTLWRKLRE